MPIRCYPRCRRPPWEIEIDPARVRVRISLSFLVRSAHKTSAFGGGDFSPISQFSLGSVTLCDLCWIGVCALSLSSLASAVVDGDGRYFLPEVTIDKTEEGREHLPFAFGWLGADSGCHGVR
jgi:hypothetical protein